MMLHTIYRPEQNINFLEDWLEHYTAIGVKHFLSLQKRSLLIGKYSVDMVL